MAILSLLSPKNIFYFLYLILQNIFIVAQTVVKLSKQNVKMLNKKKLLHLSNHRGTF